MTLTPRDIERIAPNISDRMYLFRPVLAKRATLVELKTVLTIDDLADLHELMDLDAELERKANRPRRGSAKVSL